MGLQTSTSITVPSVTKLAIITAFPDEVKVEILTEDGILTTNQAEELAGHIVAAASRSRDLDWSDDDDPKLIERSK